MQIHIFLVLCVLAPFFSAPSLRGETIAFLYALEQDLTSLVAAGATVARTETVGDRTVRTYRLGTHTVVGAMMTSGQAESAVSIATVLAKHRVDAVVTTGVVGALDDDFRIGQTVLIDKVFAWQAGSHHAGAWTETPRSRPNLLLWTKFKSEVPSSGVASGDVFIADDAERMRLSSLSGMPLVDMNLVGIQIAATAHGLPVFHLRVVSDRADDRASEDFRKFASSYRGELGLRIAELIKALPADEQSPDSYPALKNLLPGVGAETKAASRGGE
jgi:nucleoside phosphorylase